MTGGAAAVSGRPRIKSTVRHTQAVCRWTQCHSRNFGFLTHKMGMPPRGAVEIKGGNAGKSLSPVVGTEQGLKRWWLLLLCHCPHNCSQTPTSEDCALGRATRMQECFPVSFSAVRIRAAQRIKWGPVMGQANYCILAHRGPLHKHPQEWRPGLGTSARAPVKAAGDFSVHS